MLAIIAVCMFLPMFRAQFWLIDDHEIVWLLDGWFQGDFDGFLDRWLSFGDFGDLPRFRPMYYVLRGFEVLLWQDHVWFWVSVRLIVAFAFAVGVYRLLGRILSKQLALLLAAWTYAMPWVADIFFRLGPAEFYAVALSAWILHVWAGNTDMPDRWRKTALGIAVLVGIKENFLVFALVQMLALWHGWKSRSPQLLWTSAGALAFSGLCVVILAVKLHFASGVDVYGHSISVGERWSGITHDLLATGKGVLVLLSVLAGIAAILSGPTRMERRRLLLPWGIGIAVLIVNLLFYGAVPGMRSRYAYPFWPVAMLMLGYAIHVLSSFAMPSLPRQWATAGKAVMVVALLGMLAGNAVRALHHAQHTVATAESVQQAAIESRAHAPVVVHAVQAMDIEPAYSIARFLQHAGMESRLFLLVQVPESPVAETPLVRELQRTSRQGRHGFRPINELKLNADQCLELYFEPAAPAVCRHRLRILY